MRKELLNELNQMKFLFGYKPGRVISEQEMPEAEMEMSDVEFDFPEVAPAPEKEKERTREKETEERPKRRGLPSRNPDDLPYEDPDTYPQGRGNKEVEYELELDEPEMDFEMGDEDMDLDIEDEPMMRRPRRFGRD